MRKEKKKAINKSQIRQADEVTVSGAGYDVVRMREREKFKKDSD